MTEPAATPPPETRTWRPGAQSPVTATIFVFVIVAGVLLVLAAWRLPPFRTQIQRTEDAYVQGHTTVIAPQVSGYVWRVPVEDYAIVHAGDILVEIDPSTYRQRVEQARATLDAQQAQLANNRQALEQGKAGVSLQDAAISAAAAQVEKTTADLRRSKELMQDGSLSVRENDQNVAAAAQALAGAQQARAQRRNAAEQVRTVEVNRAALLANVEAARAQLHAAQIDLDHTTIRAPQSGQLSNVGVRIGQFVTNGSQLLFLVPAQRWVIANFKEKQTRHMMPGQRAWFYVDALGGARIDGIVERISPAAGSEFSALKPDNATGNFTKVPQRIPVRIAITGHQPLTVRLRPGMSVEAHVDTGSR